MKNIMMPQKVFSKNKTCDLMKMIIVQNLTKGALGKMPMLHILIKTLQTQISLLSRKPKKF